jgi:hypothetical protein
MAALMCMLVVHIMNVLMDVLFALMVVCVLVFIICMATHLGSPPIYAFDNNIS